MKSTHFIAHLCLVTFFISQMISACSAPSTEPPLLTPQVVTVSFTPALKPLLGAVSTCAMQQPEIALFVNEVSAPFLEIQESGLALRLGYPENSNAFSVPLAMEEIVIIVHPSNPVNTLSNANLVDLFTGKITNWLNVRGKNTEVQVWMNFPEDDLHQIVQDELLMDNPPTTLANMAPNPEAMLMAVERDPAAIGYLPRSWLSKEVKTVRIFPDISNMLTQPVLALTREEPHDEIRSLLHCLQSGIGQEIIQEKYNWQKYPDSNLGE